MRLLSQSCCFAEPVATGREEEEEEEEDDDDDDDDGGGAGGGAGGGGMKGRRSWKRRRNTTRRWKSTRDDLVSIGSSTANDNGSDRGVEDVLAKEYRSFEASPLSSSFNSQLATCSHAVHLSCICPKLAPAGSVS
eukprot:GHVU01149211.1.p2 GENE.GHVU01149211.1~~GHVU01149211.1.p2  ORF type:complete len:135 (-),score=37.03 GHVU01149211.1:936-1340(-)